MEQLKINDEYEIIVDFNNKNGMFNSTFKCLRHGEEWRDLLGDNMVFAMVGRIQELENQVDVLSTTTNMYVTPYYEKVDRVKELEKVLNKVLSSFDNGITIISIPLLNEIRKVLNKEAKQPTQAAEGLKLGDMNIEFGKKEED